MYVCTPHITIWYAAAGEKLPCVREVGSHITTNCSVHCSSANIGSKSSRCFEVALDADIPQPQH